MPNLSKLIFFLFSMLLASATSASETTTIPLTAKTPLFDGRCNQDEWQKSTKLALPAGVEIYLMHNNESLFVCAKGKRQDYTVIDLYIEHAKTGKLYNLHASAQLQERILIDNKWSESAFWANQDWSGFWVPYAGEEETEKGTRTKFLEGSHREIQVLREKFATNKWNMAIRVSAVYDQGEYGAEFFYPEKAVDINPSTWAKFIFNNE